MRKSVLSIKSVTKLDAGVYTGIAYNLGNLEEGGFESDPATLEVIGKCGVLYCRYCFLSY